MQADGMRHQQPEYLEIQLLDPPVRAHFECAYVFGYRTELVAP